MTIQEKIQQRMGDAASKWYWVAFNMVGQNASYSFALMHIVNRLHHTEGESVQITLPEWKAALKFGKTLIGNASMTLRKVGVIYTNHGRMTWHIEEATFWPAFEEALALIFPLMDGDDDDPDGGGTPSGDKQASGHETVGDKQVSGDKQVGGKQTEGGNGVESACDAPPIESITITTPEKDKKEGVEGFFDALRVRFSGPLQRFIERMSAAIEKIGLGAARDVVFRCLRYVETRGRSATWAYLATALDNEVIALTSDAPRQLNLLPVDAPVKSPAVPAVSKPAHGFKTFMVDGVECVRVHTGFGRYETLLLSDHLAAIEQEAREKIRAAEWRERQKQQAETPADEGDAPALFVFDPAPAIEAVWQPEYTGPEKSTWNLAYAQLQLQFDTDKFETWVRGCRLVDVKGDVFVIETRNDKIREMLQNRLYRPIARVLSDSFGRLAKLEFVTARRVAVAS